MLEVSRVLTEELSKSPFLLDCDDSYKYAFLRDAKGCIVAVASYTEGDTKLHIDIQGLDAKSITRRNALLRELQDLCWSITLVDLTPDEVGSFKRLGFKKSQRQTGYVGRVCLYWSK